MIVSREILETLNSIYGEPAPTATPQSVPPPPYTTSSTPDTMKPSFRAYMNQVDASWSRPVQPVGIGLKLTSVVSLAGKEIIDLDEIKTEAESEKVPPSTTLCSPFGMIAAENVTNPPFWEVNTKSEAVVKVEEIPKSPLSSCNSSPLGLSSPYTSDSNTDNTSPKSSFGSPETLEPMESSEPSQPSKDMFQPISILNADQISCYRQLQEVDNEHSFELFHLKFCPICGVRLRKDKYDIIRQSRRLVARIATHMNVSHSVTGEDCPRCKAQKFPLYKIPCICRSCGVCNTPMSGGVTMVKHLKFAHGLYQKEVIERKSPQDKKSLSPPDPDAKQFMCLLKSNETSEQSCNYKSSTFVFLARHIAEAHHVVMHKDPVIIKCPLCSFKQQGTAKLASHIRKTHLSAENTAHKDKKHKRVNWSLFYLAEESAPVVPEPSEVAPVVPEPSEVAEPPETELMVTESATSDSWYEEDLIVDI